jgi:hypothetical protein
VPNLLTKLVAVVVLISVPFCAQVDERRESRHRPRVDRVVGPFAALFAVEQTGIGEPLQVVRDGRLRQPERRDQLADAYRLAGVDEQVHEPHAGGFAERSEQARRSGCLLVRKHRPR